jgi:hypothetical protein
LTAQQLVTQSAAMIFGICFAPEKPGDVLAVTLGLVFALISTGGGLRALWSVPRERVAWLGMAKGELLAGGLVGVVFGVPTLALTLYYLVLRPICGAPQ